MADVKILITGPSLSHRNQGDNLLYLSVGQIIRSHYRDNVEIISFSSAKDPERIRRQASWLNIVNPRRSPFRALGTLLSVDVYFIAGAIPFHDNLWLMLQQFVYAALCKLRSGKFIINAVSVQPITKSVCKLLFRWTTGLADVFSVRDQGSADNAERLGARPPVLRTVDPGIIYAPAHRSVVDEIWKKEGLPKDIPIFGMGPHFFINRGKYFDQRYKYSIEYEEYSDETLDAYYDSMAEAADELSERGPVVFFSLSTQMPPGDDREACQWIVNRMKRPERAFILQGEYSAAELMGCLGRLDMYISTRLHGYALAVGAGVPTIAVEFHPKMRGLAEELRLEDWVVPFRGITPQELLSVSNGILEDLDISSERLRNNMKAAAKKAIEQITNVLP